MGITFINNNFKMPLKFKISFLVTLFFILPFCSLYAQENIIKVFVSDKVETINGKKYYLHTVEKGQTLYSIAIAYNRPINVIVQENNIINNAINTGQVLRIPLEYEVTEVSDTKNVVKTENIYHDVQKGETLFGISKKYNVSIAELEKLNPELKNGLKAGQRIIISQSTAKEEIIEDKHIEEIAPDTSDQYFIHIVQKRETLFSISNLYVVPVKDIIALNPWAEKGIKPKQNLKIPTKVNFELEEKESDNAVEKPVVKDTTPQFVLDKKCPPNPHKKTLNVALLIPLYLDEVSDINTDFTSHSYQTSKKDYNSFTYIQFYQGFLLALDSLKKTGLSLNLNLIDMQDEPEKARSFIGKTENKQLDLIIGPFFSEPFNIVANFAKDNKIKIINPYISDNKSLPSQSNLFNIALSAETQIEQFVNYFHKRHTDKNIIVVHNNSANEQNILKIFSNYWKTIVRDDTSFFRYAEVIYSQSGLTGIINKMSRGTSNFIFCLSNQEAFVSNFIRKLSELQEEEKIVLFGLPSWQKFNTLELSYLDKLKFHYFSTSFVDYDNVNVIEFIKKFRTQYEIEPDIYAYTGYDLAMFFLYALHEYGQNFTECINTLPHTTLNADFVFRYNSSGKYYENTYLNFLKYDNFKLIRD